jgi:hypothetical protein
MECDVVSNAEKSPVISDSSFLSQYFQFKDFGCTEVDPIIKTDRTVV